MSLFQVSTDKFESVPTTTFAMEGMLERQDLQRLLRADISPLGMDLIVIAEEFGDWEDSRRRIDLLCMDKQARLVVVEIKRTEDGGHMELQAIRYAAMISCMTVEQAIHVYAKMLGADATEATAKKNILEFLGLESIDEIKFDGAVRVVLVAADFSNEITTAVMWLNKYNLDITCIRMRPYSVCGQILVDLTQIIPLPEAAEYEVKIRAQAQESKKMESARSEMFMRFWAQLIDRSKSSTSMLAKRSTTNAQWISAGIGKSGFNLTISLTKDRARVECYIKIGPDGEGSERAFNTLLLKRLKIEEVFGSELDWQLLPGKRGCRICKDIEEGNYNVEEEQWPRLQQDMIDNLVLLEKALKGPIHELPI